MIKPDSGVPLPNGKLYDEDSWNDESALDNGPYRYSKACPASCTITVLGTAVVSAEQGYCCLQVVAEKLAWDMSKQHGFKLVTVLPSLVIGPVIGPRADATSIKTIQKVFAGELGKISVRLRCLTAAARSGWQAWCGVRPAAGSVGCKLLSWQPVARSLHVSPSSLGAVRCTVQHCPIHAGPHAVSETQACPAGLGV